MDEADDVCGPIVFQCGGCRAILGDSLAFISALEDLDAIILSGSSTLHKILLLFFYSSTRSAFVYVTHDMYHGLNMMRTAVINTAEHPLETDRSGW